MFSMNPPPLNRIVPAKLDGSAKGGIVLFIYQQLGIPIRWIDPSEQVDDLFEPSIFLFH